MVTMEDLQRPRTADELKQYVTQLFEAIRQDEEIVKIARLRRGLYKRLIEEIYPFSIYCYWRFKDRDDLCEIMIGNQGYDGIIRNPSSGEREYVEITWPIDGHKAIATARLLNEKGHTDIEIRDVIDDSERQSIINRVIKKAREKALKDYTSQNNSSLIILVDIYPHFRLDFPQHQQEMANLVEQLRGIPFKVKSVYLVLMPIERIITITDRV
jgi:hypothetical protein